MTESDWIGIIALGVLGIGFVVFLVAEAYLDKLLNEGKDDNE